MDKQPYNQKPTAEQLALWRQYNPGQPDLGATALMLTLSAHKYINNPAIPPAQIKARLSEIAQVTGQREEFLAKFIPTVIGQSLAE